MTAKKTILNAVTMVIALALCFPIRAHAQAPFYQGKTITIIQGRAPAGTGDVRVRATIPFLQKYIPGNPTIVSEFMDGGGGRKATNYIFQGARPDGLTIGNVGAGLIANAVLGEPGVQYDLDKLIYLGSPNSATYYILVTKKELGLDSLEKLRAYPGLRIGALSVGHDLYINARLFAWILGLKEPKFITGYSGPELDVALLQREVDARTQTAGTIVRRNRDWIEKNVVEFHAAIEIPRGYKDPAFAHLPELESFARSERERKVLGMFRTIRLAGSPYVLPPGVPRDQVKILQEAFTKTFRDPEFLKQYRKVVAEEPTPLIPEEAQRYVRELPRDRETIETFKQIAGPGLLPPR